MSRGFIGQFQGQISDCGNEWLRLDEEKVVGNGGAENTRSQRGWSISVGVKVTRNDNRNDCGRKDS